MESLWPDPCSIPGSRAGAPGHQTIFGQLVYFIDSKQCYLPFNFHMACCQDEAAFNQWNRTDQKESEVDAWLFAKASVKRSEGDQNDKIMKFMKWLWLATLVTAFFGPLLAANAHPGIFAFKILFFLHLLLFCFFLTIRKLNFNTSPQMKPYFIFFLVWKGTINNT